MQHCAQKLSVTRRAPVAVLKVYLGSPDSRRSSAWSTTDGAADDAASRWSAPDPWETLGNFKRNTVSRSGALSSSIAAPSRQSRLTIESPIPPRPLRPLYSGGESALGAQRCTPLTDLRKSLLPLPRAPAPLPRSARPSRSRALKTRPGIHNRRVQRAHRFGSRARPKRQ